MFFFKKKKLIEIDSKIDSVLDQLIVSSKKYEEMISVLSQIENRVNALEERIANTNNLISQNVQESTNITIEEIGNLREGMKMLDHTVCTLSEKSAEDINTNIQSIIDEINLVKCNLSEGQNKGSAELKETIAKLYEQLQQMIKDDGIVSREKIGTIDCKLNDKLDMVDSFLRLLLLNSVMDQIEE